MYIGIGSNVDPESNLKAAARLLRASFPGIAFSSVYETAPMYEEDQPTFLNAVAKFKTEQTVHDVHAVLVRIEKQLKKNSPKKYGPRTIDVDLLLYGNETMSAARTRESALHVPHPKMHERRFVLDPLCELIDENMQHPLLGKKWGKLRKSVEMQDCKKEDLIL